MTAIILPEHWTSARLGIITEIVGGGTPSRDNPAYFQGSIPWVSPTDISKLDDIWIDETAELITESGLKISAAVLLPPGSVLMTCRASFGLVAINRQEMCTSQSLYSFICNKDLIFNEYLAYCLISLKERLARLAGETTFKGISKSSLERVEIPLPPLSEQRRIASILREADEIRRLRKEANGKMQEIVEALFYDMFGDPTRWKKTIPLEQCVDFVGGGTPNTKIKEYFQGKIPWATSKDIKGRYLYDTEDHITEEAIQNSSTKLVPENTILIVVKSKILMHSLPISITKCPVCFGQDLKGLICKSEYEPQFIAASLAVQKDRILGSARGVNTEGLTLDLLRDISIPQASTDLRKAFIERIDLYDELLLSLKEARLYTDVILQSLLSQAFTGELTATWREAHAAELTQEARERDELLRGLHATTSPAEAAPLVQQSVVEERPELTTQLNPLQLALLALLNRKLESYVSAYGLHQEIIDYLDEEGVYLESLDEAGLYGDFAGLDCSLDGIRRDLHFLASVGLLKELTLRPEDESGVEHYVTAYRSLLVDDDCRQEDSEMLGEEIVEEMIA